VSGAAPLASRPARRGWDVRRLPGRDIRWCRVAANRERHAADPSATGQLRHVHASFPLRPLQHVYPHTRGHGRTVRHAEAGNDERRVAGERRR
jgi:hypothetical protein